MKHFLYLNPRKCLFFFFIQSLLFEQDIKGSHFRCLRLQSCMRINQKIFLEILFGQKGTKL